MEHDALKAWESFYVIVGSSAAALTGLQFVVVALTAEREIGSEWTTRAFSTPTIVHFCAVLLISAILSAPWHTLSRPGIALAVAGSVGIVYCLTVIRHTRRQTDYKPVLEDWLCHAVLPVAAYTLLLFGGLRVQARPVSSLFMIAATALLLLLVGIHNAWDAATYIALTRKRQEK